MSKKTLSVLVAALVLALALTGVVYGLWYEMLFIHGTVETGNVDVVWEQPRPIDCNEDDHGKEVGWFTALVDRRNPHILNFTVHNAYPSYTAHCQLGYVSAGTIPVHTEFERFIPGPELHDCDIRQNERTGSFVAACDELTVTWSNGRCQQLHQGDDNHGSFEVHLNQPASELATYTFSVELEFWQFNESNCPYGLTGPAGS